MTDNTRNRPQVPGGAGAGTVDDGRRDRPGVRGAKNPRARSIPRQTTQPQHKTDPDCLLNIISYNVRTLRTEDRLLELEEALKLIKWDIVGLCEVRRDGEETLERENNIFYHFGTGSMYGVGFLVAKKWKSHISEFVAYSNKIALLKFKISNKKILTVIQCHAPTSAHPDDDVEEFYDLLNKAYSEHRGTWNIIMGDFNAKIGSRQDTDNINILGPYGLGNRNERGERLIQFAFGQTLKINNTFFFKKPERRWTWVSPGGEYRNEIDFILSSDHTNVNNVQALNRINFSSDHRPIRATIRLCHKINRIKLINSNIKKISKDTLIVHKNEFNLELKNSFDLLKTTNENCQEEFNVIEKCIRKASSKIKDRRKKHKKLTENTLKLLETRTNTQINTEEYRKLDKQVKRNIRKDVRNYETQLFHIALENNKSLKTAKFGTSVGKTWITHLKSDSGVIYSDRDKILNMCTQYYKSLYSDSHRHVDSIEYSCPDTIPPITGLEVHDALMRMKYNRAPGDDGITAETLKVGEPSHLPYITNFFNTILKTGNFPDRFCHSNIILIHKKGEKSNINNYRPISLVSHLYKLFIKVIEKRVSAQLDSEQPPEQAGFRRGLSTTDHLQALNETIEKFNEFNLPLYLAFVDYSKAFDSLSHAAIFEALQHQNIDQTYISLIKHIYNNSTASIRLQSSGPTFKVERGVKQGDPLSPKLFTSTLEEVFRKLTAKWQDRGVEIGERRLTNLRFADDIVLFSSSPSELQTMLQDLSSASLEIGLKMNREKTKIMTNRVETRVTVDGEHLAYVNEYIYLGQIVSFNDRQSKEIARRTDNAWKTFWSMGDIMKSKLPLMLKRKLMDVCILPVMTYGAQTWSLTNIQRSKLQVCQRAMERSILGVKRTDRIRNTELRSRTQIIDVAHKSAKLKWDWAGHVCRMPGELWAKITTEWQPDPARRRRGRPRRRWRDELDNYLVNWREVAQDRESWKEEGEAFAQLWDSYG